jgi:aerobic-type carbon monoxide dehydrogenase small subunit (CoxS/CutS family)
VGQVQISLKVNGKDYILDVPPNKLLLDVLRDDLGFKGVKEGCGTGICGTCTILLDGHRASSCLMLAVAADGREITTIEGIAKDQLDPIQQAFLNKNAYQCGYCTPGMILAAKDLLDENPNPSREEIKKGMEGNLCRCTGYYKIIEAVEEAAALRQKGGR